MGPPLDLTVIEGGKNGSDENKIGLGWTAPAEDGGGPVDG